MDATRYSLIRRLCIFSGEDWYIIQKCAPDVHNAFAGIGAFVLLIFVLCCWSAFSFIDAVFHSNLLSIPISIFWSLLIGNLYLLLLYTISPPLFSTAHKKKVGRKATRIVIRAHGEATTASSVLNASMLMRLSFIAMLAIIIAQPISLYFQSHIFQIDCRKYATAIRNSGSSPLSWVITFAVVIVFLLPGYWKFMIRNKKDFYSVKKEVENRIVSDEYKSFLIEYSKLLTYVIALSNEKTLHRLNPMLDKLRDFAPEKHQQILHEVANELRNETVVRYEYWADPPFCTCRKSPNLEFTQESELIEAIYCKQRW